MSTPGGKGTAPRQQRDDEAYSQGWDRIFKKKQECERPENCSEPFCQCEVKDERRTTDAK